MITVTSRERVLMSVNHKQPDKVPVDLGATLSSGISAIAYNNLKKHLGMPEGQTRIYDVVQQVVTPEQEILYLFQVDVIDIGRACQRCADENDSGLARSLRYGNYGEHLLAP